MPALVAVAIDAAGNAYVEMELGTLNPNHTVLNYSWSRFCEIDSTGNVLARE